MNPVDFFLNRISVYRLALGSLAILALVSIVEAFFGWLPFTSLDLLLSLVVLLFSCRTTNALCALFTKATPTPESAYTTALVLFFILTPLQSANDALFFIIAGALAMISKYIFVFRRMHLFNPAAFAALALALAGTGLVTWWVATPVLVPFVLGFGVVVVRKVHRFRLFLSFAIAAIFLFILRIIIAAGSHGAAAAFALILPAGIQVVLLSPVVFIGMYMLMDPQTMPLSKSRLGMYGVLIGILFAFSALGSASSAPYLPALTVGAFAFSPEVALLIGNLGAFLLGNRKRSRMGLSFHSSTKLSKHAYEFSFLPEKPLVFKAGQYLELTIPHKHPDNRGIRRHISITSAPGDYYIRFATTIPVESSTFKDALRLLKKGEKRTGQVSAANVTGDFVLPLDPNRKIVGIAGGIGIAPFMSMFRDIAQRQERRDVVLIYSVTSPLDLIYQEEIDSIKDSIGLRVIYLPLDFPELSDWSGPSGYITQELVEKEIRDFRKRDWYLAGSEALVFGYVQFAKEIGVLQDQIKTERFPGF